MPKQFDIFVDEYQRAEGTNQEFDVYLSGRSAFSEAGIIVTKELDENGGTIFHINSNSEYGNVSITEEQDEHGGTVINITGNVIDGDEVSAHSIVKEFDICTHNPFHSADIEIYSLPFRMTTRVDNSLVISIPDDAVRNYVEQTAKVGSSILSDSAVETRVKQVAKVASDMVINAVLSEKTKIDSGMTVDVNINGTTLWRYRLLGDMDNDKLSDYDNITLGEVDIIIL